MLCFFPPFPSVFYMFLCMKKILKVEKGQSPDQQNLPSPTENIAPETPY